MVYTDNGLLELQKFLRDDSPVNPTYLTIGSDTTPIVGDENIADIGSEFIRKIISWQQTGIYSKYNVQLTSTEANGSYINRIGLVTGATIGSDVLTTLDYSIIGEKNSSFNVQVEGEILINKK